MKNTKGVLATTKGFTMIELIIYIAIASIMLVTVVGIGINLSVANQKSQAKREVYMNTRFVMAELADMVRGADDIILSGTTFGSNPASLALAYPSGNNVLFSVYAKNVTVAGNTVSINKLSMKSGTDPFTDITSDKVTVTDFTLTNLTRGTSRKNINIQLTLSKVNPGGDPAFNVSFPVETAVSIRK
jgi:prepilin-type N-terminal cleavage/methylation domain-containing protein